MNIDQQLKQSLASGLSKLYDVQTDAQELVLQPTRKEFEGTHTFVTFPIAKQAGKNLSLIHI